MSKLNSIVLLEKSVFLDKEIIISNSKPFQIKKPNHNTFQFDTQIEDTIINTSFAISFWVYISSPEKTNETDIFNYSNHPRLTYYNNPDNTKKEQNQFIVHFTNKEDANLDETSHKFSAPQQKWNFIVINYNDNAICDLFLNGELIKSVNIGNYLPHYDNSQNVSIGSNKGNYGSISNIKYHKTPLTLSEIITTYNFLQFKNPPVFD
jgi:hypothetical protein